MARKKTGEKTGDETPGYREIAGELHGFSFFFCGKMLQAESRLNLLDGNISMASGLKISLKPNEDFAETKALIDHGKEVGDES